MQHNNNIHNINVIKVKTPNLEFSDIKNFDTNKIRDLNNQTLYTNSSHQNFINVAKKGEILYYNYKIPYMKLKNSYINYLSIVFDSRKRIINESLNSYWDYDDQVAPLEKYYKNIYKNFFYTIYQKIKLHLYKENKNNEFIRNKMLAFKEFSRETFGKFQVKILPKNETYIVFCDCYYTNFSHFMLESFPRIYLFTKNLTYKEINSYKYILPPLLNDANNPMTPILKSCLDIIGIESKQRVVLEYNKIFKTKNLLLIYHHKFNPIVYESIQFLVNKYKNKDDLEKYKNYKKIFLVRNPQDRRHLSNIDEVNKIL